jgi:MFS family permease
MESVNTISKKNYFWGWISLSGVSVCQLILIGSFMLAFGVFFPVMNAEFGWSRGLISIAYLIGLLCMGLTSPLWGYLVSKFGPKKCLITGNILVVLSLIGMSQIQELWQVYFLYGLTGLGAGLAGTIAGSTVVNNWFVKKRSFALGTYVGISCLGGLIFPPLNTFFISEFGWRISWLILAGIVLVFSVFICSAILTRNRPEDMGQTPDGLTTSPDRLNGTKRPETVGQPIDWQLGEALKQPTTWLIVVFAMANSFMLGETGTHQVAFVQDLGFSPMIGATSLAIVSISAVIASLAFGALALKIDIRYLSVASFALQILAFGIIFLNRGLFSVYTVYIYSIIFGIGNGALLPAMTTFIGSYYGRANFAKILGVLTLFQVFPQASSAVIAGSIYDATSSYIPVYVLMTIFSLIGLLCAFFARRPILSSFKQDRNSISSI